MNIITGIIKETGDRRLKSEVNLKPGTRNKLRIEIFQRLLPILIISGILGACASRQPAQENEVSVKTDVKVSSPVISAATSFVSYQAVTRYMQSNDIRSQVTGIITRVNCSVAGNIVAGQALFTVQPQEAAALQKSKFSSSILTGFSDTVFAHISGQISKLNVQVGDFVQTGDVLASCIRANSLRVIGFIPVEHVGIIEKTKICTVILPNGTTVNGKVSGKLTSAETQDQTQAYIIEPAKSIFLPENIYLTVQFNAEQFQNALFVPESAVLGNEEQTSFWVMKLINDSICTKVQVEKGIKKDTLLQLIGSDLTIQDLVISEGGYGLPDSARVQVTNLKNESKSAIKPAANRKSVGSRH